MSTAWKIVGIVVLVAAVIGAGLAGAQVASAQRAAASSQTGPNTTQVRPFGPMMGNFGGSRGPADGNRRGPRMGFGAGPMMGGVTGQYRSQMQAAMAQALGMTTQEFDQALAGGKTPWQIAQEKGISADDFRTKMTAAMAGILKQAVTDGALTQAQADAMLAQMKAGFGPGMMWGIGPNQNRGPQPGNDGDNQ
jgi:hypothetical protein